MTDLQNFIDISAAAIHFLLRPHHLLCLQNYRGEGYSESFTGGMNMMVSQLRGNPLTMIRITEGADMLCRNCPNRRRSECSSCRPALFDRNVRNVFGIRYGDIVSWKEVLEKTAPLTAGRIEELCPGCQWKNICLEIAAARKRPQTV